MMAVGSMGGAGEPRGRRGAASEAYPCGPGPVGGRMLQLCTERAGALWGGVRGGGTLFRSFALTARTERSRDAAMGPESCTRPPLPMATRPRRLVREVAPPTPRASPMRRFAALCALSALTLLFLVSFVHRPAGV